MKSIFTKILLLIGTIAIVGCADMAVKKSAEEYMQGSIDSIIMESNTTTLNEGDENIGYWVLDITWTIDRPAKEVWSYFEDFSLWHEDIFYDYAVESGGGNAVVGKSEGKTLYLGWIGSKTKDNPIGAGHKFRVLKVVPEKSIWTENGITSGTGFNIFTLNEHEGRTTLTAFITKAARTSEHTEDELRTGFESLSKNAGDRWKEAYIPRLTQLVINGK